MNYRQVLVTWVVLAGVSMVAPQAKAHAELSLSQLVVELQPGKQARQDIEVSNNGRELMYVAVEPREILSAGTPAETGVEHPDPERLGLLVAPSRMVLEPGQRKLIRVAAIDTTQDRERIYRVTVKPVVGQLAADKSGLKILIAYDVLVLARPTNPQPNVNAVRSGNVLVLRNDGNISVELADGKQCDSSGNSCEPLPGGRLYAGAEKKVPINPNRRAHYSLKVPGKVIPREF